MELLKDLWIKQILLESSDLCDSQKVVELGLESLRTSKQTTVEQQK